MDILNPEDTDSSNDILRNIKRVQSCFMYNAIMSDCHFFHPITVRYGDLDGHLDLIGDPTVPGFLLEGGWLTATDVPGLGCTVDL